MSDKFSKIRLCSSCGISEDKINFRKRTCCCIPCYQIKQKKWNTRYYENNKQKIIEIEKEKYHKNKEQINKRRKQLRDENKELYSQKRKEYYQKNIEKMRQYAREYTKRPEVKEILRKSRRKYYQTANGKNAINNSIIKRKRLCQEIFYISEKDLRKIYNSECVYCGNKETTADHIIPISRGGRHSIGNLQPLCRSCNGSKGAMLMIEWIQELKHRRSLNGNA